MKVISLFQGPGGEQSGAQQLALRWGAGLFGRRHAVDDQVERRAKWRHRRATRTRTGRRE